MKITKQQLKQIIKEEVSDACENLVDGIHGIREIRGHGSPKNLSKHFGPETLRKAGVKGAPEQDLEIKLRDEMDKQLIEILGKTLEEATYALDSYDASDYIPGIIRNLETALAVLEGGDV